MLLGKAGAPVPPAAFAGAGPPAPPHGMMRPPMPGPGMMLPGWGGGFGHLMAQQLGGGMAPPYGHFMGMQPIPPPPAPGGPGTPWIQFAVDPGQISQMATPGAFLEIVNLDPQTQQADGSTSLVQITTVHPPDAAGHASSSFLGAPGQSVLRLSRWHVRAGQSFISVLVCARSLLEVAWSCT